MIFFRSMGFALKFELFQANNYSVANVDLRCADRCLFDPHYSG